MNCYFERISLFYKELENKSFRNLDDKGIVGLFINFMEEQYDINEEEFRKEFEEKKKAESESFEKYLLNKYVYIKSGIRVWCEQDYKKAKEREKYYKEKVNVLNKKIEKETDKYKRGKLKYILKINEVLHKKAVEYKSKAYIIRKNIKRNSVIPIPNVMSSNDKIQFSNLEQYENMDWKRFINFSEAVFRIGENMLDLYHNNRDKYLMAFESYIADNQICEKIVERFSHDIDLNSRLQLVKNGIDLFTERKWLPFLYVMVPQVEGLFDVLRRLNGINNDMEGLAEKVDAVNNKQKIIGYGYYAYEFPPIRNEYAHGNKLSADKEEAYDVLMDISYLSYLIVNEDTPEKFVVNLFNNFSLEKGVSNFERFYESSITDYIKNNQILQKCLNGEYDKVIQWYGIKDKYLEILHYVKSEDFCNEIFKQEDPVIMIEEVKIENSDEVFKIENINDELCKYKLFLDTLKKAETINETWYKKYMERVDIVERLIKEKNERLQEMYNVPYKVDTTRERDCLKC